MAVPGPEAPDALRDQLAGLDALELAAASRPTAVRRTVRATWPKLAAAGLALLAWQVVVWTGWRPDYVLPGPGPVLRRLGSDLLGGDLAMAMTTTLRRGVVGFGVATVIGAALGAAVARVEVIRVALGSLITGLQTMPSIAWFPLAILLFQLTERAIIFVVVLGAAPAIANGLIAGIDAIPPLLLRAGQTLGARGLSTYRHVVFPAALPSFVAGLKQGWAFAWRSLMAGELVVTIANRPALGQRLDYLRQLADAEGLLATMVAILVVGILVDAVVFGSLERRIRHRRGLL